MFTKILTSTLLFLVAIGGFFVNITINNSNSSSNNIVAIETTHIYAAENVKTDGPMAGATTAKTSIEMKEMYNKLVAALNIVLAALSFIIMPAIILASWLMSPDWTSGDAFGLREIMHDIWIIVSNIIYFVYAILLIIIALATIFGKDNFSYKTMLPKLALGILMVPFTWWFVQWTISLSTVVTASVISIPAEVMNTIGAKDKSWWKTPVIPRKVYLKTTGEVGSSMSTSSSESGKSCKDMPSECISPEIFYKNVGGIWSPLVIYGYGIFKFQDYKELTKWETVSNIGQLVHQGILGALMFLVFGILLIALIFLLMTRAIKLWVYAMFSPLFTLHFVAGKELMGKMGDGDDTFSIKEFIGLCFVPAIIALTLSFGLIVLSVMITPQNQATTNNGEFTLFGNPGNNIATSTDGKNTLVTIAKEMEITFEGTIGGVGGGGTGEGLNSIFGTIGTFFGTIIIDIIALIFIWSAFMAAKGVNKAVGKVIEPFDNMGKKAGSMAMSMPKYIPIPGTGGQSAASLQKGAELSMNKMQEVKNQGAIDKAGKLVPWAVDGIIKPADETKIRNAINAATSTNLKPAIQAIGSGLGKADDRKSNIEKVEGWIKEIYIKGGNDEFKFKQALKELGVDITTNQGKAAIKMAKGETLDENEKRLAYSVIKGMSGTGAGSGNPGTTGVTANRQSGADYVNISVGDKNINAKVDIKDTSVKNKDDIVKKFQGVKSGVSKEDFLSKITPTMTDEAAKELVEELDKIDGFFEKDKPA